VNGQLLVPTELQELLKGFLAAWDSGEFAPSVASQAQLVSDDEDDPFAWQRALRWCPLGLIELVNSRACRGLSG
jgi:DNA mismatch repair protein MLH3